MKKSKKGFTLIELLVVIAIISLLASTTMVILNRARERGRDGRRRADIRQLSTAIELYYAKYGSYPNTGGAPWTEGKCVNFPETTIKPDYSGANAYIPNLAPEFIDKLPGDPNVNGVQKRCYYYSSDGTSYYNISAHLGAESGFSNDDKTMRLIAPDCTQVQPTFTIDTQGRCW